MKLSRPMKGVVAKYSVGDRELFSGLRQIAKTGRPAADPELLLKRYSRASDMLAVGYTPSGRMDW